MPACRQRDANVMPSSASELSQERNSHVLFIDLLEEVEYSLLCGLLRGSPEGDVTASAMHFCGIKYLNNPESTVAAPRGPSVERSIPVGSLRHLFLVIIPLLRMVHVVCTSGPVCRRRDENGTRSLVHVCDVEGGVAAGGCVPAVLLRPLVVICPLSLSLSEII